MNSEKEKYTYHFFIAAVLIIVAFAAVYAALGQGLFSHCDYDSYTRQAAAWWHGSASLPGKVSWLELANYNGKYFVSFPPFPSVVQFILYPVFGMKTPDNLVNTLFALASFVLIYRFLMRRGYNGFSASVFSLLMTLGSNLFYLSVTGWVWFSAQTEGFFFSALAVYLIYSSKKTAWYFSFFSLGIAFACRPFQLAYFPLILYMLYSNIDSGKGFWRTLSGCIKYILPLVFIGACVAAYNYIRFGNIFEFGHDYLKEFQNSEQFSFSYVPDNFLEILKLPYFKGGTLVWPEFNGTLFFLVNPVFIMLAVSFFKRLDKYSAAYMLCFILQFILLLTHKTMGGWQFGCRYMTDMIPFMLIVFESDESYKTLRATRNAIFPVILMLIGIAINIYGPLWLYPKI
jgi:hypothetical protein